MQRIKGSNKIGTNKNQKNIMGKSEYRMKIGWKILIAVIAIFLILLPFIFEATFTKENVTIKNFFILDDLASTSLTYYGGLAALAGTVILGYLTYRQTQRANERSETIDLLQISISQQLLNNVKQQGLEDGETLDEEQKRDEARGNAQAKNFEIRANEFWGNYAKLRILFTNHNSFTVGNLEPVKMCVPDKDGLAPEEIPNLNNIWMKFQKEFLPSEQSTFLETDCPELFKHQTKNITTLYQQVPIQIQFRYNDDNGVIRFCKATSIIRQDGKSFGEKWNVEYVGKL